MAGPLDTPGTDPGFVDLVKGLSGGQYAQLAGATLGGLNFGSPRNPFYPLQGMGALGALVEQQRAKQRRAAMLGPLLGQLPPEARAIAGPLFAEGDLSGGDLLRLTMLQAQQERETAADNALPSVFKTGPARDVELFPGQTRTGALDLAENPEAAGTAPAGPVTERVQPTLTRAQALANLEQIKDPAVRAGVARRLRLEALPEHDPEDERVRVVQDLARRYQAMGLSPQDAVARAKLRVGFKGALPDEPHFSGGVLYEPVTQSVKTVPGMPPSYRPQQGGYWTEEPGKPPTFTKVPDSERHEPNETDLRVRAARGDKEAQAILAKIQADKVEQMRAGAQARAEGAQKGATAGAGFTPEAIETFAQGVADGGPLPPMGMGKASTEARIKIMNRAAAIRQERGDATGSIALQQQAYKANTAELMAVQRQRGIVMAYERSAEGALKRVEELSKAVPRTQVPAINAWLLSGQERWAGDPQVAAFSAAVRTAINEYAGVVQRTGGATDTARRHIEEMLNRTQTPEQIVEVLKTLRYDMAQRGKGYEEQIAAIRAVGRPAGSSGGSPGGLHAQSDADRRAAEKYLR